MLIWSRRVALLLGFSFVLPVLAGPRNLVISVHGGRGTTVHCAYSIMSSPGIHDSFFKEMF